MTRWLRRYEILGDAGLADRPSARRSSPTETNPDVVARIKDLRRTHKFTTRQIDLELNHPGLRKGS